MLLSPNQSPTPSAVGRSVSEGPHRRLASEPHRSLKKTSQREQLPISRQESIEEAVEQVPLNLARVVVNMQEYYASELEAERQRTEDLATQNEEMMKRMEIMEKRLQMHVILMDGFVNFMREAKEGNFAVAGSAELEIAQAFGGEHLEEVRGLVSNCAPVQQSVEQVDLSLQIPSEPEDDSHEVTQTQDDSPLEVNAFDQMPPTPDVESAPVRSTGRRAPKRKNPPMRPYRAVKRRTRANVLSVKLREAASWTPINPQSRRQLSADSGDEHVGENGDLDYTPDLEEDEDQEPGNTPASERASPSPSPSESEDDFELDSAKPRYSVPRSVGYRHAAGPPGRRFKYHRMPKTVALVWQEWKHGSHGNPAIEALEKKYNTSWRMGTLQERKYASNYVGVRQKIVRKVEEMCEEEGLTVEQACEKLDERVDGRMQLLMTALRKGEDPLVVIQRRRR
ncbi:hypothetical protein FAVG1_04559 [Fusarium avenaceum]|nr:hypothetical protein FAVG1_04559 [Fusarium avenaceum]